MSVPASLQRSPGVAIRGRRYPLVLPSLRDPRLHLAGVIVSLHVLGQVAFDFRLSLAQILVALLTCAVLEVGITFGRQRVIMWPASALLTGNSVAFILRVPGTEHGDWWSMRGWWIFAATAAVSLLSKYVIRLRGRHVFNPSNFGLVLCFLVLGPELADPLDFWWGPMSPALALALGLIVIGGFAILSRLGLLAMAISFWLVFVAAIAVVAAAGHAFTARWHLGPIADLHLWVTLATSPEILVFLFFMLTDPKTVPAGRRERIAFGISVALLAALLVGLAGTEFWAKVGVLGALAAVCAARAVLSVRAPSTLPRARAVPTLVGGGLVAYAALLAAVGLHGAPERAADRAAARAVELPAVVVRPSDGVDGTLDRPTALRIAADLVADLPRRGLPLSRVRSITLWLEAGPDQFPLLLARLDGTGNGLRLERTVEVTHSRKGYTIAGIRPERT